MCVCVSVIRLSWLLSHPCGVTVSGALHHSPRCFRDVLCLYHSFLCVCHNYGMGLPTVRVSPKPEGRLWQNRFPAVCWKYEQSEYRFPAVCWKYEQSEYRFPAVCWKYEQSEYRFPAVCWNMSRRQASNGICGIVCVASIFMCLELWVDRGRSPHQSHVGGVAPALLPTPFIPHARVAALVL